MPPLHPCILAAIIFPDLWLFCTSDEVGAIVADIGTLHSRFGSAGQDSPKHVFHSVLLVHMHHCMRAISNRVYDA